MKRSRIKVGAVALICVALGVGISAIASSAASTSPPASSHAGRMHARARIGKLARRTVQGSFIVHSKTGWATVQFARGTVESVSGSQLTLAEGTRKATYKTVTLTLPSKVLVRDNGQKSTLSSVSQGQRALVVIAPRR
ncbi:MAG TPA: hypothetical protein VMD48_14515, partial [Solirubrobacteraceae bacterium]|nr:hypothetical protein [Solirubrobacteraceae bacterium]